MPKHKKALNILSCNHGHNNLKLYNVLVKVRSVTTKTKFDIKYNGLGMRGASQFAERLKTLS